MKITKIEVCDFRGFPGPAVHAFEFGCANNLLIYGENGSGKSSLFRAIQEFFNRDAKAKGFEDFLNIDSPEPSSGHVTVHFDNRAVQAWPHTGRRPLNAPPASQTALRTGCLDYRSLLETNFSQKGSTVNLFEIAVNHLVSNRAEPVPGGGTARIGDLWKDVLSVKPRYHYKSYVRQCQHALDRFNAAFAPVIGPLIDKASELLSRFPRCDYRLALAFQPVEYDTGVRRDFRNRELLLSVYREGELLDDHHNFLNEARLSAIGLVIYLAGLLTSVPPVSQYSKLLVLDDVLIGLDMENRLPVMAVIGEFFADWHVILLTHDKVWYEMVRHETAEGGHWGAYEMYVGPVIRLEGNQGGSAYFLARAREHLANGDFKAAGNYVRNAFEWKLKKHCEKKSLPVRYFEDSKKVTAEMLWQAAKKAAVDAAEAAGRPAPTASFGKIEMCSRVVMNPLSHSQTTAVGRAEVEAAILAIHGLFT